MIWCGGGVGEQQSRGPLPVAWLPDLPAGGRQEIGGLVEGEHRAGRLPISATRCWKLARVCEVAPPTETLIARRLPACVTSRNSPSTRSIVVLLQVDGDAFE